MNSKKPTKSTQRKAALTRQRLQTDDPVAWLTTVMQSDDIAMATRMAAAKVLASLERHVGKKARRHQDAMAADKGSPWEGLMR